ncbi:MAG: sigma-70 family RNA polymerase sigma factor [Prevotella sp.]|nr:sigma-70 family RNA polymerase sigma factor [Prevotella sp.]
MDFAQIWNDFREGDDQAFSILFETYLDPLYRYGMKFVSDEDIVKDCIQDLFVKIHTNRATLSATQNPKFYLLLSLKNLIIDTITRNKRLTYVSPENLPFIATYQYGEDEDQEEINEETKEKFEKVLGLLNPRQKEAIYLRFQMELSYEEISQLLDINYQSARNLIHRSITKIRENIDFSVFILLFLKTFS